MPDKRQPMTTDDIQSALHGLVSDATTYLDSELSPDRALATRYYRGDPFGNEETGRSTFVLTDVRDTVLAMLPSLVRLFLPTSGHVIRYQARPKTPDAIDQAVAMADQATEYVNAIVLEIDNNGFAELYSAFKDALVRKIGILKWGWEDRRTASPYYGKRLDVQQFEALALDPDTDILSDTEITDPTGIVLHDVDYRQYRSEGLARLWCIPPEELLISRDARTREDASFFAHRTEKTASELRAMGVSQQDIDTYGGSSSEMRQSIEEIARRGGLASLDQAVDPAMQKHLYIEAYPYLDVDGDGEAELVCVRCLGPGCRPIGEPEPCDERPFALFCPDPEPHVLIGQSVADRVMDLQKMKSSIVRAAADGLADTIFPPTFYMEGVVDKAAMDDRSIGQKIPVRDGALPAQAVMELRHEWRGQDAMTMLGYLDAVKQQRIGPLPATLDPDALQSTPEVGVKATVQAASEQLELIARVFAATGMKQLGQGLLKLLVTHQPRARLVRLRNQYVPVDPRAWDADMDVSVQVALGTSERVNVLMTTAMAQKDVLMTMGLQTPLTTLGKFRHTMATLMELQGIPDVGKYWDEVPADWRPEPEPPSPDPNLLIAQAEVAKAQAKVAEQQAEMKATEVELAQKQLEWQTKLAETDTTLDLKRQQMLLDDEFRRHELEVETRLKMQELELKYTLDAHTAETKIDVEREKLASGERQAALAAAQKPNGKKKMTMKRNDGRRMDVEISEGET